MVNILTFIFIIVSLLLGIFIYIQQGKGGLGGLGQVSQGSQTLFGGSGGQNLFEKITWALGLSFIAIALGISILKTTVSDSRIQSYQAPVNKK